MNTVHCMWPLQWYTSAPMQFVIHSQDLLDSWTAKSPCTNFIWKYCKGVSFSRCSDLYLITQKILPNKLLESFLYMASFQSVLIICQESIHTHKWPKALQNISKCVLQNLFNIPNVLSCMQYRQEDFAECICIVQ